VEWIDLAEDRGQWQNFVNAVMKLWLPQYVCVENFSTLLGTVSVSRRILLSRLCLIILLRSVINASL